MVFENAIWDIVNKEWIDSEPEYFLTKSSGYEFREPTETEYNQLLEILSQIIPEQQELETLLVLLSWGLRGQLSDVILTLKGRGGNGKSLITDYISRALGDYYHKLGVEQITSNKPDRQSIANIDSKRLVISSEPTEGSTFNSSIILQLSGNRTITARRLHVASDKVKNHSTFVLQTNNVPKFNQVNDAIQRRLIICPFTQLFKESCEMVDYLHNPNVHPKNSEYVEDASAETMKYVMMKLLMEHFTTEMPTIPQSWKDETKDFFQECGLVNSFLVENIEHTGKETDFIQLKTLYDLFLSENADKMTKQEKKHYGRNKFYKEITESPLYSRIFKEQKVVQTKCYRNVIVKCRLVSTQPHPDNNLDSVLSLSEIQK